MPKSKASDEKVQIEAQVSRALKSGPKSNGQLREALGQDPKAPYPPLDRTLQTLRRKGKIKVLSGGRWTTRSTKLCDCCKGKGWVRA